MHFQYFVYFFCVCVVSVLCFLESGSSCWISECISMHMRIHNTKNVCIRRMLSCWWELRHLLENPCFGMFETCFSCHKCILNENKWKRNFPQVSAKCQVSLVKSDCDKTEEWRFWRQILHTGDFRKCLLPCTIAFQKCLKVNSALRSPPHSPIIKEHIATSFKCYHSI